MTFRIDKSDDTRTIKCTTYLEQHIFVLQNKYTIRCRLTFSTTTRQKYQKIATISTHFSHFRALFTRRPFSLAFRIPRRARRWRHPRDHTLDYQARQFESLIATIDRQSRTLSRRSRTIRSFQTDRKYREREKWLSLARKPFVFRHSRTRDNESIKSSSSRTTETVLCARGRYPSSPRSWWLVRSVGGACFQKPEPQKGKLKPRTDLKCR